MGAFLEKPITEKTNAEGAAPGIRYALSSMQGWRCHMEDAHTAEPSLDEHLTDWSFFAVFDGHAGETISDSCARELLPCILSEEFRALTKGNKISEDVMDSIKKSIHSGFLQLDEKLRSLPSIAIGEDKSGSTAVCSLLSPSHVFLVNCGDSRAVLYRSGGSYVSTQDHKPVNPTEKERIQNAGGSVMIQRVNGSLAVSRSLGDYEYKTVEGLGPCEQLVSPEPEIFIEERTKEDEFIVLACDGIWDVISREELYDYINSRLKLTDDLSKITDWVVDTCFHKGSRDNMSIIIVAFDGAAKVCPEAIEKEKQLEQKIEKKVTELCQCEDPVFLAEIMKKLSEEDLQDLPPGAGLVAKKDFVKSIWLKLRPECENAEDPNSYSSEGCED